MKNIIIIGGGTGTFTLLSGLRKFPANNSVIVSSADDGGSTGVLRKDLGVFPPGDIRQCLIGLSYSEEYLKKLFSYRFDQGDLSGHAVGNIIIAALEKIMGGIEPAIAVAGKFLNVRGAVIPVTLKSTILTAVLENGKKIIGEHKIDDPSPFRQSVAGKKKNGGAARINKLLLSPHAPANPRAIDALKSADVIVFGPGDLYTSILPNVLVRGIAQAIDRSHAKKVLVTNLMTKPGQTDGFRAEDFVQVMNQHLGKQKLDAVIVNTKKPEKKALSLYRKSGAQFVEPIMNLPEVQVITAELLSEQIYQRQKGDALRRSMLRHDSEELAKIVYEL